VNVVSSSVGSGLHNEMYSMMQKYMKLAVIGSCAHKFLGALDKPQEVGAHG